MDLYRGPVSVTINGANASNVYWQVGSSATLKIGTAFQGTLIAYSSITLSANVTLLNGRAFALNGAVTIDSNTITANAGVNINYAIGMVGIGASTTPTAALQVFGDIKAAAFTVVAAADLSEEFPVVEPVKPGMLVAIDPSNPGKLHMAVGEYNKRVVGVVAGANDFPIGFLLGQGSGNGSGVNVALSGRVYVFVDATNNAVEPGDMLTTSARAGYAMSVIDHNRMQGAVIGKAMTGMEKGKTGLVLVLVSLQ